MTMRERERAYRFVEVKAWGEERKNMKKKKKTGYLGLFTGSQKKGFIYIFFKKKFGTLKNFSLCQISKNWKKNWITENW